MHVIRTRNVQRALCEGLRHLQVAGIRDASRFGDVVVAPTPVTTVYERPWERVVFWPLRDANPFFHLFEALWLLAGRNDVEWLAYYNEGMRQFSDDGKTFHGAYGYRWRQHFKFDQLEKATQLLRNKPRTRRCVIQMWDCAADLHNDEYPEHKDVPCNDLIFLWLDSTDRLCMTVCCRSNDMILGGYGANAVHFSILQEYIAAKIGVDMGVYNQISNNFHAYTAAFEKHLPLADEAADGFKAQMCPYSFQSVRWTPIVTDAYYFDAELDSFMSDLTPSDGWRNEFFPEVAIPMRAAYKIFKEEKGIERYLRIHEVLGGGMNSDAPYDWLLASIMWMQRRRANAEAKLTTGEA